MSNKPDALDSMAQFPQQVKYQKPCAGPPLRMNSIMNNWGNSLNESFHFDAFNHANVPVPLNPLPMPGFSLLNSLSPLNTSSIHFSGLSTFQPTSFSSFNASNNFCASSSFNANSNFSPNSTNMQSTGFNPSSTNMQSNLQSNFQSSNSNIQSSNIQSSNSDIQSNNSSMSNILNRDESMEKFLREMPALPPVLMSGSGKKRKQMEIEERYPLNIIPMSYGCKTNLAIRMRALSRIDFDRMLNIVGRYEPWLNIPKIAPYQLDIGQLGENTVWAIDDFVHQVLGATNDEVTLPRVKTDFDRQVEMYTVGKTKKRKSLPSEKFECTVCGKQFRGSTELKNHYRTHTGEKPLVCSKPNCTRRFANTSNLRAHERTHDGIKPYACKFVGCGKRFAHSVTLKEHVWMHAGVQPYRCKEEGCGKQFTQVSNFARHQKLHAKKRSK